MNWLRRKLMHTRIFLGIATEADIKQRGIDVLKSVQDAINEYDMQDVHETNEHTSLADVTRRERPSKKW